MRRLLLIGRLDEAEHMLAELDPAPFQPASRAAHELEQIPVDFTHSLHA